MLGRKCVRTEIVIVTMRSGTVPEGTSGNGSCDCARIVLDQVEEFDELAQGCFLGLEGCRCVL